MTAEETATAAPYRFIVVGHDISSNALGRAISMALVARVLGPTELFAFGRSVTWRGTNQFDVPVVRLSKKWKTKLRRELTDKSGERIVVWLSKGIAPLHRVAKLVAKENPEALIILDLDDDDAGLAESFAKRRLLNRLRLHPMRRGNDNRIRQSQYRISKVAAGFTFSSNALATAFPESFVPKSRIPHVRKDSPNLASSTDSSGTGVKFGSFGTLRPHKGSGLLLELMRQDRTLTLVTFAACGLGGPEPTDSNWVEVPPDMPLAEAYNHINVSLIPITETGNGAQFQLPAKLIDSLQAGVPVLASPTPAIKEIAEGVFTELNVSDPIGEIAGQIRLLARQNDGHLGRERFLALLTPEAAAQELSALLASTSNTSEH